MDILSTDLNLAHAFLPEPFSNFNAVNGKQLYEEVMYKPTEDAEDTKKSTEEEDGGAQSIMILHLAGRTKGLLDLIESNKKLLLKGGHMNLDDQTMIIEILFHHAFKADVLDPKN